MSMVSDDWLVKQNTLLFELELIRANVCSGKTSSLLPKASSKTAWEKRRQLPESWDTPFGPSPTKPPNSGDFYIKNQPIQPYIDAKYQELGGEASFLGKPISAELWSSGLQSWDVGSSLVYQEYECGIIVYDPACPEVSPCALSLEIYKKWRKLEDKGGGGGHQYLGNPLTDAFVSPDGEWQFAHFQFGSIYWNAGKGAFGVLDSIWNRWTEMGFEESYLGYPVLDEIPFNQKIKVSNFQGGGIYSDGNKTWVLWEPIRAKWAELDSMGFSLGTFTSETHTTPDGQGRYTHFENGSIYWHPDTGAHEVHGAIRQFWSTLGWENSYLGYPVTDELKTPGPLRAQRFQNGGITWTPDGGAKEVPGKETHYLVTIDKFHIYDTRSWISDTDHVSLAVKVGDHVLEDIPVKHMGDVGEGDHSVGIYCQPFKLESLDTMIKIAYTVVNQGGSGYPEVETALKTASMAILGIVTPEVVISDPSGIWDMVGEVIGAVSWIWTGPNCDGVAAVGGMEKSGHWFARQTEGIRVHSETILSKGNAGTACGDYTYDVTWSVVRL